MRARVIMENTEIADYIQQKFAAHAELTIEQVFGTDATLAEIVALSPKMTNSIDLMEAFAKTANGLRKDHGVQVRLPALPLDTPSSKVLEVFLEEFARQKESVA